VVTFEMCGNDGLQARSAFKSQTAICNYKGLDDAVQNCKTYVDLAMQYINANAYSGAKTRIISNLYYPGYAADNVSSNCTDAATGAKVNMQEVFLSRVATMNWNMCNSAQTYRFECADNFAQYMGADYDSNGDGQVDSVALRYVPGETLASYLTRITSRTAGLRSTIRDSNAHMVSATSSFDYIQSDDTHPTYTGGTVNAGLFGSTTGSGAARYTSFTNDQSPIWNRYGHERMGWAISVYNAATP